MPRDFFNFLGEIMSEEDQHRAQFKDLDTIANILCSATAGAKNKAESIGRNGILLKTTRDNLEKLAHTFLDTLDMQRGF